MRLLDDWIKNYLVLNEHNEAPMSFHFWTGVGVIASALRRKVWLPMGYFEWTPNFYVVLVAPPGIVNKSTSISIGQRLLDDVPGIRFGSTSVTWQAMIGELASASEAVLMEDGNFYQMSCLSFFVSELGTFMDFEDKRMIDMMVELWDGKLGTFSRSTMGNGITDVTNPWVNMISCTTPAWLSDNMPKTMVEGGFSARCIWVYENKKRQRIAYPQLLMMPETMKELRRKLVHDLEQIALLKGPYTLTKDAYAYGTDWYNTHCDKLEGTNGQRNGISGYMARAQTHMHKLAMVLSASRRGDLIISRRELEDAASILSEVEGEVPQVFTALSTTVEMEKAGDIVTIILTRKRIRRTELYQMFFHKMSSKEFGEAISSAIDAGYIRQSQSGTTVWLEALLPVPSQTPSQSP
ncbi:MAG TPA: DUF3987 domain-containing protein [Nitrospiraceae bacterium]